MKDLALLADKGNRSAHPFGEATRMNLNGHVLRSTKLGLDLGMLCVAYWIAFLIRFEGLPPDTDLQVLVFSLPFVLLVKFLCLAGFRVPGRSWRYVSVLEAKNLMAALSTATAILCLIVILTKASGGKLWTTPYGRIPLSVLLIDLSLSFTFALGMRVAIRLWTERAKRDGR